MSKHLSVSASTLRAVAQVADMGKASELERAIQAIIEGRPFGESSLDHKITATFELVDFSEVNFRDLLTYDGQALKRHRNGGGWVPLEQSVSDESMPFVAETAYVGPFAMVFGRARVFDEARITDRSRVYRNARVSGRAQVRGDARISDKARVSGRAQISDGAHIYENAQVYESAVVYHYAHIFGYAQVHGNASVCCMASISDTEDVIE